MRRQVKLVERPSLRLHIEYDHVTVGELGNILVRLQAVVRSMAGLGYGKHASKYPEEQPRFVTLSVSTDQSIDVTLALAIIAVSMSAPEALQYWSGFAREAFRHLKMAIVALAKGEASPPPEMVDAEELQEVSPPLEMIDAEKLRIEVTKGKIEFEASRDFLQQSLSKEQSQKLANFLSSLTGPSRKASIGDEESEVSIYWPDWQDGDGIH